MSENKVTATKVTQYLDISLRTLDNWYRFYRNASEKKPENMPELPNYEQLGPKATRFWNEEDLPKLMEFKNWIPHGRSGVMGRTNERYWSEKLRKNNKNKDILNMEENNENN